MAARRVLACCSYLLFLLLACVVATEVGQCPGGATRQLKSEEVNIVNCTKPPCKLRKKSTILLEVQFTPEEDVESVKNAVYANILGVPFPFIGVDGTGACTQMSNQDGSKADCPLKKGNTYTYKGSFKVLDIYPRIRVDVVWSLKTPKEKSLWCFVVPVRIL